MTSPKPSRKSKADSTLNNEAFRLLFANHPIPMWVYDLKTLAFLEVNDAALEKYGYTRDEFLALTIKDICPVKDVTRLVNSLEQKRSALHHSGEWRHCLKNGQVIDVEITTHTLDFEGHKAALVTAQDITERKRVEEALRESEDKFKYFFDYSNVGKSVTLLSGGMSANQALCDMFGYTLAELQNKKWQEITDPDDVDLTQRAVDQLLSGKQNSARFNKRYLHRNGSTVWADLSTTLRRDKDGKPLYLLTSVLDITARKQAEDALKEYNTRLETAVEARTSELRDAQEKLMRQEKLAVLGQLAGGVGHELRNPLAVINNAIYYLKLVVTNGNEKVKEYLGIIETEAHTAEKIITDLLDFARIKSVDVEAVSALKLAERVLERYPAPKVVRVRLELPEDLPMLYVDPRQMEQVLSNLVINACQAMSAGGELTITARREQGMIAMAVKDTGVGIPPENMEKLFEPLFTTKAKGIGFGLVVSQKLIEANGGCIEVQSEAGKGSTFTLYLPVSKRSWNES